MKALRAAAVAVSVLCLSMAGPTVKAKDKTPGSITVAFGAGLNTAQPGNKPNHHIIPQEFTVRITRAKNLVGAEVVVPATVNFIVSGFHWIWVYQPGVTVAEVNAHVPAAGTFVNYDANVNTTVNKLRLVLGDSSDQPAYIETIPRLGYCFVGSVERKSELAKATMPAASVERSQGSVLPLRVEAAGGEQPVPATSAFSSNFWSSARNQIWAGVVLLCGVLIGMSIVLLAHRVTSGS